MTDDKRERNYTVTDRLREFHSTVSAEPDHIEWDEEAANNLLTAIAEAGTKRLATAPPDDERWPERAAAVAHLIDGAAQYLDDSGEAVALILSAEAIAAGEHAEHANAGEYDDMRDLPSVKAAFALATTPADPLKAVDCDGCGQLRVQLAGCSVAALDGSKEQERPRGSYGWSPAYADTLKLRRAYVRLCSKLADADGEMVDLAARCLARIDSHIRPRTTDVLKLAEAVQERFAEEDDEGRYIAECAAECDCCPECSEHPCGGVLQGFVCDRMPCRCDERWEDDNAQD